MAIKKEAYLYLSAALRAREARMLTNDRAERMLDAPGFEEAAKLLTDCGYPDMSQMSAAEIEKTLAEHRAESFAELTRMAPDARIVDVFRMKYDYHNAKTLIKARALGLDPERLFIDCGRVKAEKLKNAYDNERWSELPKPFAAAMQEASEKLSHTANPQLADFALDRAYFKEMKDTAAGAESKFLCGYVDILDQSNRLKSIVRVLRMGRSADYLNEENVFGDRQTIDTDKESLAVRYSHTLLENAAILGAEAVEGGSITAFELACDNAVNRYLRGAKLVSFGEEPLAAYIAAVEGEITAIRMILTGRLAGIKPEVIRERLRDLYA